MSEITQRDLHYMRHALELAKRGAGHVSPNPMVGAVIVKDDRIIGEGWHEHIAVCTQSATHLKTARKTAPALPFM